MGYCEEETVGDSGGERVGETLTYELRGRKGRINNRSKSCLTPT
jgi:hypothetical protein